jgi:3-hydroxyacyl-CoA dehydrogenase
MNSICVVGMGIMGSQIGIVCAKGGFKTFMVDVSEERTKSGMDSIHAFLKGQEEKGKATKAITEQILSNINAGADLSATSRADLVIEAVFEEMGIKKEIFKKLWATQCVLRRLPSTGQKTRRMQCSAFRMCWGLSWSKGTYG